MSISNEITKLRARLATLEGLLSQAPDPLSSSQITKNLPSEHLRSAHLNSVLFEALRSISSTTLSGKEIFPSLAKVLEREGFGVILLDIDLSKRKFSIEEIALNKRGLKQSEEVLGFSVGGFSASFATIDKISQAVYQQRCVIIEDGVSFLEDQLPYRLRWAASGLASRLNLSRLLLAPVLHRERTEKLLILCVEDLSIAQAHASFALAQSFGQLSHCARLTEHTPLPIAPLPSEDIQSPIEGGFERLAEVIQQKAQRGIESVEQNLSQLRLENSNLERKGFTELNATLDCVKETLSQLRWLAASPQPPKISSLSEVLGRAPSILSDLLGEHFSIGEFEAPLEAHMKISPRTFWRCILAFSAHARSLFPAGGEVTLKLERWFCDAPSFRGNRRIFRLNLSIGPSPQDLRSQQMLQKRRSKTNTCGCPGNLYYQGITQGSANWRACFSLVNEEVASNDLHTSPNLSPLILVVENQHMIRRVVKRGLEMYGLRVVAVDSVSEAQKVFEKQGKEINVMIADIRLDDGDGLDLVAEKNAAFPALSCIVSSGFLSQESANKLTLMPEVTYLPKPFNIAEIYAAVRALIESSSSD